MTEKAKPWEMPGVPFKTEAAFWGFVKGLVRRGWTRHPVRVEYVKSKRFKAPLGKVTKKNPTGLVWAVKCEMCGETFKQSQIEVDHIYPSQQERWYDDIDAFVRRMFYITFDDIQILCKERCHPTKTLMDARGITFEEALIEKEILLHSKNAKTQKAFLESKGIVPGKNAETRKQQIREVVEKNIK